MAELNDLMNLALSKNVSLQQHIRSSLEHIDVGLCALDEKIRDLTGHMMDEDAGTHAPSSPKTAFWKPSDEELHKYALTKSRDELRECMAPYMVIETRSMKRKKKSINSNADTSGDWSELNEQKLLEAVDEYGGHFWDEITQSSQSEKSIFETFQHYQQCLNNNLSKDVWSPEEDDVLKENFLKYGDSKKCFSKIAEVLEGRAASQCRERWKSINPQLIKGRWDGKEERLLYLSVRAHGEKFSEVSQHIPRRDGPKCREKWVKVLSPDVLQVKSAWSQTEDAELERAVSVCGEGNWSAISKSLNGAGVKRPSHECRSRWKCFNKESYSKHCQQTRQAKDVLPGKYNRRKEKASIKATDVT